MERQKKDSIESDMLVTRVEEVIDVIVQLPLDSIGRQFGEQGSMPDCIESSTYVQRDGPDLTSDIESLHPLLEQEKQHVKVVRPHPHLNW